MKSNAGSRLLARILVVVPFCAAALTAVGGSLSARVEQTPGGPKLFVDGKVVRPRFFYGSPTCLCNISCQRKTVLKIPFASDRDTAHGRIALDGYPGVDPIWYSDAKIVDLTAGTTNVVQALKEGPLEIDFGKCGAVHDALSGAFVCNGPKAVLPFRLGQTRLFKRGTVISKL